MGYPTRDQKHYCMVCEECHIFRINSNSFKSHIYWCPTYEKWFCWKCYKMESYCQCPTDLGCMKWLKSLFV